MSTAATIEAASLSGARDDAFEDLGDFGNSLFFGVFPRLRRSAPAFFTLISMLYLFLMTVNLGGTLDRLMPSCLAIFSAST